MQERLQSKTAAHTLQRINRATTVVACLRDFAAYINDYRQGGTAAFVSLDIMLAGSVPEGKFERLASDSHFRTVQNCSGRQQILTVERTVTYRHFFFTKHQYNNTRLHTDRRQPYRSLGGARSGHPNKSTKVKKTFEWFDYTYVHLLVRRPTFEAMEIAILAILLSGSLTGSTCVL